MKTPGLNAKGPRIVRLRRGCNERVLGIAMPKVILDQPQVVAAVGQREAAGMSKHVRMHERQAGTSGRLGEQIVHRLTRERLPPFGDEQPG